MHILIPVYFNAPAGGLHENVFSTAKECIKNDYQVTVLCKEGIFTNKLLKNGINVINTTFEASDLPSTFKEIVQLHSHQKIDVIHTHPFHSRKIAQLISKVLGIPIFLTMHGKYYDQIGKNIEDIDLVFTVSEGIKEHLLQYLDQAKKNHYRHKFFVVPNGVDRKLFNCNHDDRPKIEKQSDVVNISLVTRLDKDKEFIINIFYKALEFTSRSTTEKVKWTIVGDGTLKDEIAKKCNVITEGKLEVEFVGWKENEALRDEYINSDIILAPGRCALEGMSCGKPVIALGSKGYIGLIDYNNWMQGVYTNFGGVGNKAEDYIEGSVGKDLSKLLNNKVYREEVGDFSESLVNQFFDEEKINHNLLGYYKMYSMKNQQEHSLDIEKAESELEKILLSSEIKEISINKNTEREYDFTIDDTMGNLQYAWYIYEYGVENRLIDRTPFGNSNHFNYYFSHKGKFKAKCIVKTPNAKISLFSKEVIIE
ncbi:glycosyltransferase family 4 protein [Bacillus sp. es.034]|uniref:glycosyltransferase family 4 protein n=1 Tax=Bacillus sp. es.034 TaxID=1761763 RepID=UPI000BF68C70|nr:glycosyltransferase family 4 protein [Bacillus sp. es.034]PFG04414.1 glycosyltransferase involved in cell wall biosynthesis [Bacillus sp. es.034]